jgi:poly(hydroxyalkanoate) depolymerase family esterase
MKPQKKFNRAMIKATCLTAMGRLVEATKLIQRSMANLSQGLLSGTKVSSRMGVAADNDPQAERQAEAHVGPLDTSKSSTVASTGSFLEDHFEFMGQSYPYRLFVPKPTDGVDPRKLPLIVLLHGCQQDALDFSQGIAMNQLASDMQCLVLYPEQITAANSGRCWNWFEPEHQQRGQGEPGMVAALTLHVMASLDSQKTPNTQPDPTRVYIAGLSAGGAMASLVAGLYPDIFAALGVHSGLPSGAANNILTAFSAMQGASSQDLDAVSAMPTIVFHGSADATVHPVNSAHIIQAAQTAFAKAGITLTALDSKAGTDERAALRTVFSDAKGMSQIENWSVLGGTHAWSGGDSAGSYTDPQGPSASAAMLNFFLQHRLKN